MNSYTITDSKLHIVDSYQVSKKKFDPFLNSVQAIHGDSNVWKRSRCSMKLEWATHNAAYAMHIMRDRTKDVYLNYPQSFFVSVAYAIAGSLVWLFIK